MYAAYVSLVINLYDILCHGYLKIALFISAMFMFRPILLILF
jgi:hypothetical protein